MTCSDNDPEELSTHQELQRGGITVSGVRDRMEKAGTEEEGQGLCQLQVPRGY